MQVKSMQVKVEVDRAIGLRLTDWLPSYTQDPYILAAIVYGSVARGEAWEKSDIDIDIIQQDGLGNDNRHVYLVEEGINISASFRVASLNAISMLRCGFFTYAPIRSHAKLLLCKDESIASWFAGINPDSATTGSRIQLLGGRISGVCQRC